MNKLIENIIESNDIFKKQYNNSIIFKRALDATPMDNDALVLNLVTALSALDAVHTQVINVVNYCCDDETISAIKDILASLMMEADMPVIS